MKLLPCLAAAALLAAPFAWAQTPTTPSPAPVVVPPPAAATPRSFEDIDRNKDGVLARAEYESAFPSR